MEKSEAIEIMEILYSFYPNFNKRGVKSFNKIWIERLMEGDYKKTLKKTEEYTVNSPYPPSLADIIVLPPKEIKPNPEVEQVKQWEAEVKAEREAMTEEDKRKKEERKNEMWHKLFGDDSK